MIPAIFFGVIVLLIAGLFALAATNQALRRIHRIEIAKIPSLLDYLFYYRLVHKSIFSGREFESVYFLVVCTQSIARFLYAFFVILLFQSFEIFPFNRESLHSATVIFSTIFEYIVVILLYLFIGEITPKSFGVHKPEKAIQSLSHITSCFMLLFIPLSYPMLALYRLFSSAAMTEDLNEPQMQVKQELIEMIQDAETGVSLDQTDKELIESVVTFRNRIAREIMVPRVDIFSLPGKTTIREAAELLQEEGYSRVPVYKNSVDEVIGILMYKDILLKYMEFAEKPDRPEILNAPIETIVKKTMYTPETKRITHLLQEFRKRQLHLAIVVDEYGGTEGIVTIEDILEEIVGEIADEYDEDTELFQPLAKGAWILDARMSIIDIEEELDIKIPQDADYDTIGGFIYHRTGTIPSRGFVIDHDDFKLEVMKSNERGVEKVKLTSKHNEENP